VPTPGPGREDGCFASDNPPWASRQITTSAGLNHRGRRGKTRGSRAFARARAFPGGPRAFARSPCAFTDGRRLSEAGQANPRLGVLFHRELALLKQSAHEVRSLLIKRSRLAAEQQITTRECAAALAKGNDLYPCAPGREGDPRFARRTADQLGISRAGEGGRRRLRRCPGGSMGCPAAPHRSVDPLLEKPGALSGQLHDKQRMDRQCLDQ